jgi:hypothetical protein
LKKNNKIPIFSPPHSLNTPVLFLIFNRLASTKKVFESIKEAKPPRLYIASDGPRNNKPGEDKKVLDVRNYINSNINWDCEVITLFRDKNLGCKYAVSGAIDWFFEHEEMGIIVEDDCLPSQSFFWFCEELLKRYKDDLRIWHIAGNNFQFGWKRDDEYSYYFSYYGSFWGWATWKSRWKSYDVEMKNYPEDKSKNYLWDIFGNQDEADFRINNFEAIKNGFNTWDYQWAYTRFINSGLSVVPEVNLVKNLGFGKDATHTQSKKDKRSNMIIKDINFPLKHQLNIIRDKKSDDRYFNNFLRLNFLRLNYITIKIALKSFIIKILRK